MVGATEVVLIAMNNTPQTTRTRGTSRSGRARALLVAGLVLGTVATLLMSGWLSEAPAAVDRFFGYLHESCAEILNILTDPDALASGLSGVPVQDSR